tara:strand:- start:11 stop:781 length:771 start_codon:yes stop_codon:yes gene_type:complete
MVDSSHVVNGLTVKPTQRGGAARSVVVGWGPEAMISRYTIVLSTLLLVGCVTHPPRTAADVVSQVANHVRTGNVTAASMHLTQQAKARGLKWPSALAEAAQPVEIQRRATWRLKQVGLIGLSYGGSGWRINAGALNFLSSATPRNALKKFSRGILGSDYEMLVELLPKDERKRWSPGQLMRTMEEESVKTAWRALAASLAGGAYELICVDGKGECVVRLGGGRSLVMRKEAAHWKIVDILPFETYIPKPSRGETEG